LPFPTFDPFLADSNIVAPFWSDVDLRVDSARVYYKTFNNGYVMHKQVSSKQEIVRFSLI